jgi:N-acetylglucosaminyldiphosphoundecaprenol N-acetyl-beta-D-mannosaminyltransferase
MSTASSRAEVLGYAVDRIGLEETVERCRVLIAEAERSHQVSLNAAKVVRARSDERLAEILRDAELLNADGQSIVWAARLLGDPLPERVAGIDLMFRLLEVAQSENLGVFFLGGRADVLAKAVENVRSSYPNLRIGGFHHGYFSDSDSTRICAAVNSADVAILFIAMSSPRKEYWAREHRDLLDVPLVMGVGGAVDILAGSTARAPAWMQRAGLEWLFRLVQEPRRLGPRYFVTNVHFLGLMFRALVQRVLRRFGPRSGAPADLHPKKAP